MKTINRWQHLHPKKRKIPNVITKYPSYIGILYIEINQENGLSNRVNQTKKNHPVVFKINLNIQKNIVSVLFKNNNNTFIIFLITFRQYDIIQIFRLQL